MLFISLKCSIFHWVEKIPRELDHWTLRFPACLLYQPPGLVTKGVWHTPPQSGETEREWLGLPCSPHPGTKMTGPLRKSRLPSPLFFLSPFQLSQSPGSRLPADVCPAHTLISHHILAVLSEVTVSGAPLSPLGLLGGHVSGSSPGLIVDLHARPAGHQPATVHYPAHHMCGPAAQPQLVSTTFSPHHPASRLVQLNPFFTHHHRCFNVCASAKTTNLYTRIV